MKLTEGSLNVSPSVELGSYKSTTVYGLTKPPALSAREGAQLSCPLSEMPHFGLFLEESTGVK